MVVWLFGRSVVWSVGLLVVVLFLFCFVGCSVGWVSVVRESGAGAGGGGDYNYLNMITEIKIYR